MKNSYLAIIAVLLASMMMVTACGAKSTQAEPSKTEQAAQPAQTESESIIESAENDDTVSEEFEILKQNEVKKYQQLFGKTFIFDTDNGQVSFRMDDEGDCSVNDVPMRWEVIVEETEAGYTGIRTEIRDEEDVPFYFSINSIDNDGNATSLYLLDRADMKPYIIEINLQESDIIEESIAKEGGDENNYTMQTVEITMENWQDYFEITVFRMNDVIEWQFSLKDTFAEEYKENGDYVVPYLAGTTADTTRLLIATGEAYAKDSGNVDIQIRVDVSDSDILFKFFGTREPISKTFDIAIDEENYVTYLLAAQMPDSHAQIATDIGDDGSIFRTIFETTTEDETLLNEHVSFEVTEISGSIPVWEER